MHANHDAVAPYPRRRLTAFVDKSIKYIPLYSKKIQNILKLDITEKKSKAFPKQILKALLNKF